MNSWIKICTVKIKFAQSKSKSSPLWCFYELCRVAELFQCVSISRIFCDITIAVLLKRQFQHSHISYPVTNDHKIHILWIHKIHSICHACPGQVNLEICNFAKLIILQFWIYPKLSINPTFVLQYETNEILIADKENRQKTKLKDLDFWKWYVHTGNVQANHQIYLWAHFYIAMWNGTHWFSYIEQLICNNCWHHH